VRVLLVGAGASYSIKDVESGYYHALQAAGVDLKVYALDRRIVIAQRWLMGLWRERGKPPDAPPTWPDAIYRAGIEALEMALRFDVDWVLAISGMYLHPDVLVMMRRAGLRAAVILTESPYDDEQQARVAALADVCWTTERSSVPFLREANPATFYLRHAYDPERHTPRGEAQADVPSHDVVFVGTGFQERIDLLSGVDWRGIDLGLYGEWNLLSSRHRLRQYLRGGTLDNARTAALYRQAKIGLNLYRTSKGYGRTAERIEHAESMNPRAYELAACGVFQISNYRAEVMETFDWSVPTFGTALELQRRIRYFFARPHERLHKAQSSRQRIEPHTFAARAAELLADFEHVSQQPIAKGA
jgi:spore maturation protein CgeB